MSGLAQALVVGEIDERNVELQEQVELVLRGDREPARDDARGDHGRVLVARIHAARRRGRQQTAERGLFFPVPLFDRRGLLAYLVVALARGIEKSLERLRCAGLAGRSQQRRRGGDS